MVPINISMKMHHMMNEKNSTKNTPDDLVAFPDVQAALETISCTRASCRGSSFVILRTIDI